MVKGRLRHKKGTFRDKHPPYTCICDIKTQWTRQICLIVKSREVLRPFPPGETSALPKTTTSFVFVQRFFSDTLLVLKSVFPTAVASFCMFQY